MFPCRTDSHSWSMMNHHSYKTLIEKKLWWKAKKTTERLWRQVGRNAVRRKEKGLNRETLDLLCQLATTESDRCLIKYSVWKGQSLSAKKEYGFTDLHGKEDKIMNAVQQSPAIREAVMKLASVKHKATLKSLGYALFDDSENSSRLWGQQLRSVGLWQWRVWR
jgi:hypothetical protein